VPAEGHAQIAVVAVQLVKIFGGGMSRSRSLLGKQVCFREFVCFSFFHNILVQFFETFERSGGSGGDNWQAVCAFGVVASGVAVDVFGGVVATESVASNNFNERGALFAGGVVNSRVEDMAITSFLAGVSTGFSACAEVAECRDYAVDGAILFFAGLCLREIGAHGSAVLRSTFDGAVAGLFASTAGFAAGDGVPRWVCGDGAFYRTGAGIAFLRLGSALGGRAGLATVFFGGLDRA